VGVAPSQIMTLPGSLPVIRVAIACQDANFAGALASLADAQDLTVSALVDSLPLLAYAVENGEVNMIAAVDPSIFPPDRVVEVAGQLPVLMVGRPDNASAMIASVEAGALGYADSEAPLEDLIEAIRSVAHGVAVIPPVLLGSLLRHVVDRQRAQRKARERLAVLSVRERQVFELTARGFDKQAVANELFISSGTARTHVQNAFRKLNLHSVAELVALASECGLEVGHKNERRAQ
jgi:DNA-binding NarL/FixJ family response regulator